MDLAHWCSLMLTDDATADRSSRIHSEVYRAIPPSQNQLNATNLIAQHFIVQMDNDLIHPKSFSRQRNGVFFSGQSPYLNPL